MIGVFVRDTNVVKYSLAIVLGHKLIETRSRNMLRKLIGKRVAIIQTSKHRPPMIIGYVDITAAEFCPIELFDKFRTKTLIPPGNEFDVKNKGKWLYHLANPIAIKPYQLPDNAIRHGRSWAEF